MFDVCVSKTEGAIKKADKSVSLDRFTNRKIACYILPFTKRKKKSHTQPFTIYTIQPKLSERKREEGEEGGARHICKHISEKLTRWRSHYLSLFKQTYTYYMHTHTEWQ